VYVRSKRIANVVLKAWWWIIYG